MFFSENIMKVVGTLFGGGGGGAVAEEEYMLSTNKNGKRLFQCLDGQIPYIERSVLRTKNTKKTTRNERKKGRRSTSNNI